MNRKQHESPAHSAKFLRQRKFLLVLPVIVCPFLILLLWTTGLVGEVKAADNLPSRQQGLNLTLPSAAPAKDSNWNKMKYYEQADKDSAKLKSQLKNDPYRKLELEELANADISGQAGVFSPVEDKSANQFHYSYDPYPFEKVKDPPEQRVYKKLAALNKELEDAAEQEKKKKQQPEVKEKPVASVNTADVDRLENMMQSMQKGTEEDGEVKQLNEMLEKIMDIQHPDRMQEKIKEQSEKNKRQVFPVQVEKENIISVLEPKKNLKELLAGYAPDSLPLSMQTVIESNQFYSLDNENSPASELSSAIEAVIPETQTVMNGASLQLRLLQELYINGMLIPRQSPLTGTVSFKGNRLYVSIESIYANHAVLPVNLILYNKDGIAGLPLDASALNDAAKQTMTGTMQGIDIGSLDPSIGAQAASAGIQAAKSLINKKTKLIKMTVPAGYQVLLVDGNKKDK